MNFFNTEMPQFNIMTRAKLLELYEAKLAESGLTLKDAEALGLEPCESGKVFLHPGIKIPYYNPDGSPMSDLPRLKDCEPFWRYRILGALPHGAGKYFQPANTLPCAYFPKGAINWPAVVQDVSCPLVITEGEFKAAKACKEGFPTVGLGGVWNWRSKKFDTQFLESLRLIKLARRTVYLCFDSDVATNANVGQALYAFATELFNRGADVRFTFLPQSVNGAKVGLDDFLVAHGADAFGQYLSASRSYTHMHILHGFNERYCVLGSAGIVMDKITRKSISIKNFPLACEGHHINISLTELAPNGKEKHRIIKAAKYWLEEWPLRKSCSGFTFEPGQPEIVERGGQQVLNTWHGWGVESVKGSVKPFLDFIDYIFQGASEAEKLYALRWLGWPIKHPGAKLATAFVLYSSTQGTGKTLLANTIGKIYGEHYAELTQTDIESTFNDYLVHNAFLSGDEITGKEGRQFEDRMKKLITQVVAQVNPKYIAPYTSPVCANWFFTSNRENCFYITDEDRRFFVHAITAPKPEPEFFTNFINWRDNEGGLEAIRYYFEHELDYGGFNPMAPAPFTSSKLEMLKAGRSVLDTFADDFKSNAAYYVELCGFGKRELLTCDEYKLIYELTCSDAKNTPIKAATLTRSLQKNGAISSFRGEKRGSENALWQQIYIPGLPRKIYYAWTNKEKWLKASLETIRDHIVRELKATGKKF